MGLVLWGFEEGGRRFNRGYGARCTYLVFAWPSNGIPGVLGIRIKANAFVYEPHEGWKADCDCPTLKSSRTF